MKYAILVNKKRCTGCWTCSMACKVAHDLQPNEWWLTVRTIGSGAGIDEPAGQWPNCTMSWQPVYSKKCMHCADRVAEGEEPHCVYNCPTHALSFGNLDDASSAISKRMDDLINRGYRIYKLPKWEGTRHNIYYADI